jgi:hypothetical protein
MPRCHVIAFARGPGRPAGVRIDATPLDGPRAAQGFCGLQWASEKSPGT